MPPSATPQTPLTVSEDSLLLSLCMPGDLVLVCTNTLFRSANLEFQRTIARVPDPKYTHAMVCVYRGVLVEATLGVAVLPSNALHTLRGSPQISEICILRPNIEEIPEDCWSQLKTAGMYHIGKTYNYLVHVPRLKRRFFPKHIESTAFCSELCALILAPLNVLPEEFGLAEYVMPGTFQMLPSIDPNMWSDVTSKVKRNWAKVKNDGLDERFERECDYNLTIFNAMCDTDKSFANIMMKSVSSFLDVARAVWGISPKVANAYLDARLKVLQGMNWKIDKNVQKSTSKRVSSKTWALLALGVFTGLLLLPVFRRR
jgi:hypothetical protein